MEPDVRAAGAADLDALVSLVAVARDELTPLRGGALWRDQQARRDPLAESLARDLADTSRLVLVGTLDDVVLGYASARCEPLHDGSLLGVIDEIAVDPEARSVGLGAALLEECLAWCRARGCRGVDAFALPGARETKNFFESAGFTARLLVVHRPLAADG